MRYANVYCNERVYLSCDGQYYSNILEQRYSTREFISPVLFATSMSTQLILQVHKLGRVLLFAV